MPTQRISTRSGTIPQPKGTSIVSDPLEIRRLLTRASEDQASASLKVRGSETLLKTKVLEADPKGGLRLETGDQEGMLNPERLHELLSTGERECLVLIYLQGRHICGITTQPVEIKKKEIRFAPPAKVFKIQRRKDIRYEIPSAYEYVLEMDSIEQPGIRVQKRLIDISENGLSFFVLSPREAALFRPGAILSRCLIKIQNHEIPVILKIRNRGKQERGRRGAGNKIGAEFEQIARENRVFLSQFVYSQAPHLFY